MNVHDIPMVLFTVISQLSVGTFLILGVVQFVASRTHEAKLVERVVSPVLYAIGPAMVFGLAVSMLHMGDITHTFNVVRHWESSWLSREILFGVAFAAFGFLFAILEWFKVGSARLRQVIAGITAVLGIGLIIAESMIYYSVVTVPAWHSWAVPVQFFGTALLLGALSVGAALMVTTVVRARGEQALTATEAGTSASATDGTDSTSPSGGGLAVQVRTRVAEINAPTSDAEWTLTASIMRGIAVVGAGTSLALLVMYPLYMAELSHGNATAQASLAILAGPALFFRLLLLVATAVILGAFVFRMAERTPLAKAKTLVWLVVISFILALASEFIGRALHYALMVRVGI